MWKVLVPAADDDRFWQDKGAIPKELWLPFVSKYRSGLPGKIKLEDSAELTYHSIKDG